MYQYKITKKGWAIIVILIIIIFIMAIFAFKKKLNLVADKPVVPSVESDAPEFKSDMIDELKEEINKKNIEIDKLKTEMEYKDTQIIEMQDVIGDISCSIYFLPNSSTAPETAGASLDKILKAAQYIEDRSIVVEGNVHAPKNKEIINYGLIFSVKRAESVAGLLEQMGIKEDRLKIIGNGGSNQFYYNDDRKSIDMSRRVDVYFE